MRGFILVQERKAATAASEPQARQPKQKDDILIFYKKYVIIYIQG